MAEVGKRIKRIKNQLAINDNWLLTYRECRKTFYEERNWAFQSLRDLHEMIVGWKIFPAELSVGYLELAQRKKERALEKEPGGRLASDSFHRR
jgi:hypothetical protein